MDVFSASAPSSNFRISNLLLANITVPFHVQSDLYIRPTPTFSPSFIHMTYFTCPSNGLAPVLVFFSKSVFPNILFVNFRSIKELYRSGILKLRYFCRFVSYLCFDVTLCIMIILVFLIHRFRQKSKCKPPGTTKKVRARYRNKILLLVFLCNECIYC